MSAVAFAIIVVVEKICSNRTPEENCIRFDFRGIGRGQVVRMFDCPSRHRAAVSERRRVGVELVPVQVDCRALRDR